MDAWADIRRIARQCHERALVGSGGDRRARALVDALLQSDDFDLEVHKYAAGSGVGDGVLGHLQREAGLVHVLDGQKPEDEVVVVAHEIGHFRLHTDPNNEVTIVAGSLGGDPVDSGAGRVEGYSPRERKEIQADVFAGEFLCPSDWLRGEIVGKNRKPSEIAIELGLPRNLVLHQAIRATLLPPLRPMEHPEEPQSFALDESQNVAATWEGGPLLVDAGPGTGKTRTLVHRVGHILAKGAPAGSILALTFSNKAAEEMRVRISSSQGDAAVEMWVGTFHAFGLELVTKWASRLGRSQNVRIFDQTNSLALLEDRLTHLPLRHYQNLFEPAYELVHVLQAISRCKDELISPAQYLSEARAALAVASPEELEVAEKAVEVGEIYAIYEQALRDADAVDFGDLVMLSATLLRDHTDIREECQRRFQHILVDEYQDVNLASAKLLQQLAGGCENVWVVADQRQSIYRFRGAKPENVANFQADFSGARRSLNTNYRSGKPVVDAFAEFSRHMASDPHAAASWAANRGAIGQVSLTVAPTVIAEAAGIRDEIERLKSEGIPYRDQVVLARSHLTLSRITSVLESLGVPLLYMGDLFERSEICDLLCLLSIDAERGGAGLMRVAQLPEYGAAKSDALAVARWADENGITIVQALAQIDNIQGMTQQGKKGLACLSGHLSSFGRETSPWDLLTTWLFERSEYLRPLLTSISAKDQQSLIAIYQFLKVCGEYAAGGEHSRKRFLDRIRRIEALNQDSPYRAVASEASDFEAVRVMTLHGSKGLEFPAVHLPAIATRYMPANRQANRCPPPSSLGHLAVQKEDHDAEEECLFFVGLSRARDHLSLSRAERYTQTNASASKFLTTIGSYVSPKRVPDFDLGLTPPKLIPPPVKDAYEERELDLYLRCPRRYQYEAVDDLRGRNDTSAYLRFHRCVYRTIGWLEERARDGTAATEQEGLNELLKRWEEHGPRGHGFEAFYRDAATGMVKAVAKLIQSESGQYDRSQWTVAVGGKMITITPDRVILGEDGRVTVQRVRTGRKTKSEPDNRIYALLRAGAAKRYPTRNVEVGTYYPALDEYVPASNRNDGKLLQEYADAIAAIERGEFPADPKDTRQCPNCQSYFVCDG